MKILLRLAQAAGLSLALTASAFADQPLKIATSAGPVGQLAAFAAKLAKEKGQDVKIVELGDWVALNEVVNNGDVDANLFQHATYLALQNKQRGFNLVQADKVGVIAPVPQETMFVTAAESLFEPLIVVIPKRSRAKPVTRTTCPALTRFELPVKTKIPSDVAGLPSPVASWMKKPLFAAVPSKSPTTTPCVVTSPVSAAFEPLPWIW